MGKATANVATIEKDMEVVEKLKTADAAQAVIDMGKLVKDMAKTPKNIPVHNVLNRARKEQEKATTNAKKSEKILLDALHSTSDPQKKKEIKYRLEQNMKDISHSKDELEHAESTAASKK